MIDSHVFIPGPVCGLQGVPGGALTEPRWGLWWSPGAGLQGSSLILVYDETIEVVIDSHVFTPGPVCGLQGVPGGALTDPCWGLWCSPGAGLQGSSLI